MRDNMIVERACAKINLTLSVGNKRPDGYHNISSVMQTVTLCDTITLTKAPDITLECNKKLLPKGEANIAFRAAQLFFTKTGIDGGVDIKLKKYIPVAAGLGGGSADAAAVLRGLDRLYETALDTKKLCEIGKEIGADVPFCIVGGTALAEGIGEQLTHLQNNTQMNIVVAIGGEGVSTKYMYDMLDESGERLNIDNKAMIEALQNGDTAKAVTLLANDFEGVCMSVRPAVAQLKQALIDEGAIGALMSGSGSSVFGWFADRKTATQAAASLRKQGYFAAVSVKC